jgi:hypothetical protein
MNRRDLLKSGVAFGAIPLLSPNILGLTIQDSSGVPKAASTLSPAVLNGVSKGLGVLGAKFHQRTATPSDFNSAVLFAELLRQHMMENNFDTAFRQVMSQFTPNSFNNEAVAEQVYQAAHTYDSTVTLSELQASLFVSPDKLAGGISQLQTAGYTPLLSVVESMFQTAAAKASAISFKPGHGLSAKLLQVDVLEEPNGVVGTTCAIGIPLSIAVGALAFGCAPLEPAFEIICPTVAILSLISWGASVGLGIIC